jgi:hypothetical protein
VLVELVEVATVFCVSLSVARNASAAVTTALVLVPRLTPVPTRFVVDEVVLVVVVDVVSLVVLLVDVALADEPSLFPPPHALIRPARLTRLIAVMQSVSFVGTTVLLLLAVIM